MRRTKELACSRALTRRDHREHPDPRPGQETGHVQHRHVDGARLEGGADREQDRAAVERGLAAPRVEDEGGEEGPDGGACAEEAVDEAGLDVYLVLGGVFPSEVVDEAVHDEGGAGPADVEAEDEAA